MLSHSVKHGAHVLFIVFYMYKNPTFTVCSKEASGEKD